MRRLMMGWVCCGSLLAVSADAEAQIGRRPLAGAPCGCGATYAPPVAPLSPCPCAVSQPIVQVQPICQTQLQPIVQTQLQPQQVVSYRDVAITQYRQEQVAVQVPVTTVQQVTRDEGSYQMVWVPRMVTHQVPQTTYQTQIGYRTVPYQATQRVAQVETRYIPQQTVQYVPQTTIGSACCGPAGVYQQAMLPSAGYGAVIPQYTAPPALPGAPTIQSVPAQQPLVPNPPETGMHSDWQTVEPRHATAPTDMTMSMAPSAALIQTRQASWAVTR